ncbi:MAG: LysM peptidoglycan-binding domain-containing protein, partial [Chloroflexi bacterium]|nr:LysM peptidoglycan-binding domain-containing protein [Chloroflexota bacterium]
CGGRSEVFKKGTPAVKAGGCRGPAGTAGGTATPAPRGPVFPTTTGDATPTPTPTPEKPTVFYYTVREGDTIEFVAELFAVDLEDLRRANGIIEGEIIISGDVLIIPGQTQADSSPDPEPGPDPGPDPDLDVAPEEVVVPVPSPGD